VKRPSPTVLLRAVIGPAGGAFRRFWLATAISVLGTWMASIALALRMYDVTGSPAWVSALLFAEFTPSVVIGFLLGDRLDRLRVRRSLVACDLGSAAVFAALALTSTPWVVVALAALGGVGMGVSRPLSTSAVPMMVADDDLEVANGALGTADHAMTFLGELVGGVLVATVGANLALVLNSGSFLVSALLISTCAVLAPAPEPGEPAGPGLSGHFRTTLARIGRNPVLRQIAVGWSITTFVIGVEMGVIVPLLRGTLDASPSVVGLLLGLGSLGLVAGSMFGGARRSGRAAYPLSLAGIGASTMIIGAAPAIGLAALGLALLGLFNGVALVLNRIRVVRATEPSQRSGVISFLIALSATGQAGGTVCGGLVATAVSPRWSFVLFGVLALAVAAPLALAVGPRPEWDLRPSPWLEDEKRQP
jgi:MFS family permease